MIPSRLQSRALWPVAHRIRYGVGGGVGFGCCSPRRRFIVVAAAAQPRVRSTSSSAIIAQARRRRSTAVVKTDARTVHHRARGYLAGLHSYQPPPNQGEKGTTAKGETETTIEEKAAADFESFESAWEAIQSVPDELLNDFEDELWETQSKRFVHGTKHVSVIDAEVDGVDETTSCHHQERQQRDNNNDDAGNGPSQQQQQNNTAAKTKVVRYLVLNERPNLVQTAVEVPRVGAPYHHYYVPQEKKGADGCRMLRARPPPPISQTHLGGLAMVLPFWYKANGIIGARNEGGNNKKDERISEENHPSATASTTTCPKDVHRSAPPPKCLLIGAGGCSLAHTLATNLFLEEYNNQNTATDSRATSRDSPQSIPRQPELTAVEACPEILRASWLWFGAGTTGDGEEEETTTTKKKNGGNESSVPEPPFFDLVHDTGESYLESFIEESTRGTTKKGTTDDPNPPPRRIDILVIDAEDGSAPPESMRDPGFWKKSVLPSLNNTDDCFPVVGVNSIGTPSETAELVRTMSEAFCGTGEEEEGFFQEQGYAILVIDPPPEAKVTDRHKLIFALPRREMVAARGSCDDPATCRSLLAENELKGHVDVPAAWEQQIKRAVQRAALGDR